MPLKILLFSILISASLLLWLVLKKPSNDGNWQTQFAVLPSVELSNDIIRIKNIRDFRYTKTDQVAEARYLDREYRLSELESAWYGVSHFGGNGLAHVLMSFEFSGGEFLVVSIEARLEKKKDPFYNPLKGLFRAYTKTIVLATEQDVIGLRTHIRDERVHLYKLKLPELYSKTLLLNFLREAQVLNDTPTFYNTLIDNCMTGLLAQSDRFRNVPSWIDKRILLPGYSDQLAYELGYIDTDKPFKEVRDAAKINPSLVKISAVDFSRKIRKQTVEQ